MIITICIAILITVRMMQQYNEYNQIQVQPSSNKTPLFYIPFAFMRTLYAFYSGNIRVLRPEGNQMCDMNAGTIGSQTGRNKNTVPEKFMSVNSAIPEHKNVFQKIRDSGRLQIQKILCFFRQTRGKIAELYRQSLPNPHADLAFWVVFGYETAPGNPLLLVLRKLGVSDMVVASGYQVTFVSILVSNIFSRKKSLFHCGCRLFFLWCYVCLVGFQASILRSALSRSFLEVASISGRKYRSGWALFLSGAVLLLLNPAFLFSLGFQFSFLISSAFIMFSSREEYTFSSFSAPVLAWFIILPLEFAHGSPVFLSSVFAELALLWVCPVLMTASVVHLCFLWIPGVRLITTSFIYICTTVYLDITRGILQLFDQVSMEIQPSVMVYTIWTMILLYMIFHRFFQRKTRKYHHFHPD